MKAIDDRKNHDREALRQSLVRIASGLSTVSGTLSGTEREVCESVVSRLQRSVIPQLAADCPLLVTVAGGASTGKSTLFNTIAGKTISASGSEAGLTKRMVAAIHPNVASDKCKMEMLFERFRKNSKPRVMVAPDEARQEGDPVYVVSGDVPEHLVLIDTPDFNTGTREGFTNRPAAKEILDVSDVILYLTSNTEYNNKSETDFIRSILSEIGVKKVALLYRINPYLEDGEVRKHMDVLLANIYQDKQTADKALVGIWRIDEDNEVGIGKKKPEIRPVGDADLLMPTLARLDPTQTRTDVIRGEVRSALEHVSTWIGETEMNSLRFRAYSDALKVLTRTTALNCFSVLPQGETYRIFKEEWERARPRFVRYGHCISHGVIKGKDAAKKAAVKVVAFFKRDKNGSTKDEEKNFTEVFGDIFSQQAHSLLWNVKKPWLQFDCVKDSESEELARTLEALARKFKDDCSAEEKDKGCLSLLVRRPPLPHIGDKSKLGDREIIEELATEVSCVVDNMEPLRKRLKDLVDEFRGKMTKMAKFRKCFSASLEPVAVLAAVAYVVCTGDFTNGVTIAAMFGANDLLALPALATAIATIAGVDKKMVESRISNLLKEWIKESATTIEPILQKWITGRDISVCAEKANSLGSVLKDLKSNLNEAEQSADSIFATK